MLKSLLLFALFCFLFHISFAGFETGEIKNTGADTVFRFADVSGRPQPKETAGFVHKIWPENGKYLLMVYTNNAEARLVRKTSYADSMLQIPDGPFEEYHENGKLKDEGFYTRKKRNGTFRSWYETGALQSQFHYTNDLKTDTGKSFYQDGVLSLLSVTDKNGNGTETRFYTNGRIKLTGPLAEGKKNGTWTLKRENGTNSMQMEFKMDSVTQTACFEEDGITPAKGPCIYEQSASFPGGLAGWRNFLLKNLKYPAKAIQKDIEGTVMLEFMVDTTGKVGEIKVVSSPHEWLSAEALRLMENSPKWEPAIQYNRKVKGRLRQPIYFRLQ